MCHVGSPRRSGVSGSPGRFVGDNVTTLPALASKGHIKGSHPLEAVACHSAYW